MPEGKTEKKKKTFKNMQKYLQRPLLVGVVISSIMEGVAEKCCSAVQKKPVPVSSYSQYGEMLGEIL